MSVTVASDQDFVSVDALLHAIDELRKQGQPYGDVVDDFVGRVCDIISDHNSYQLFLLKYLGEQAQLISQTLLRILCEFPTIQPPQQAQLRLTLLQLLRSSNQFPAFLRLPQVVSNVLRIHETPNVDIYRGNYQGQAVLLKRYRGYRLEPEDARKLAITELVLRSTNHPGVVAVLGTACHLAGSYVSDLCLASPFPANGTVLDYLEAHPGSDRSLLLRDVIHALSFLHGIHIVHGNVKGANVTITASGRARIANLDLSETCLEDDSAWSSHSSQISLRTVPWKAPEMLSALLAVDGLPLRPNRATDMYAFACLAYEMYVNKPPYWHILPGGCSHARIHCIIEVVVGSDGRPEKPADDTHGLTAEVWAMMEQCWDRESSRRPSAIDLSMRPMFTGLVDSRPVSVD